MRDQGEPSEGFAYTPDDKMPPAGPLQRQFALELDMSELRQHIKRRLKEFPHWRYGQAVFNCVNDRFPDLAAEVRNTGLDAFYNDGAAEPLLEWVRQQLEQRAGYAALAESRDAEDEAYGQAMRRRARVRPEDLRVEQVDDADGLVHKVTHTPTGIVAQAVTHEKAVASVERLLWARLTAAVWETLEESDWAVDVAYAQHLRELGRGPSTPMRWAVDLARKIEDARSDGEFIDRVRRSMECNRAALARLTDVPMQELHRIAADGRRADELITQDLEDYYANRTPEELEADWENGEPVQVHTPKDGIKCSHSVTFSSEEFRQLAERAGDMPFSLYLRRAALGTL